MAGSKSVDDEEKLTPAVPARVMTRRSMASQKSARPKMSRGTSSSVSEGSVYSQASRDGSEKKRSSHRDSSALKAVQSSRLFDNVQRQQQLDHRESQTVGRSLSEASSSGWETDRGPPRVNDLVKARSDEGGTG